MENKERGNFYLPALDGLRFVAFLLVFFHNAPANTANPIWNILHEYGWIGVDLFFCLSGFLITKLLVNELHQTGKINVRYFYTRRVLRIWPLYFLYIPFAILFTIYNQGWSGIFGGHLAGLVTFTYDFVYLFLTSKIIFILAHLWTISYEIQFYVVIPWILRKVTAVTKPSKWIVLGCIFLTGSAIRAAFIYLQVKHPAIYMLPFTHFEALLGGIAIGIGLFDDLFDKLQGWILLSTGILCNSVIIFLPNTYEIGWSLMLTYPLVGIGMLLILLAILRKKYLIFGNKLLVYLGKISYGLYIFHLISIMLVDQLLTHRAEGALREDSWHFSLLFVLGLGLTILVSSVSYHFFEKRFLNLKKHFNPVVSRPI